VVKVLVNHQRMTTRFAYNERRELVEELWTGSGGGQAPAFENDLVAAPASPVESSPSASAEGQTDSRPETLRSLLKQYDYDPAGNRRWMKVDGAQTDYVYNAASRLDHETNPDGSVVQHVYDEWGNEITRTTSGATPTTETYGYNRLNLLSSYVKWAGPVDQGNPAASWQYDYWPTGERYGKTNLENPAEGEVYIGRGGDVATEYTPSLAFKNRYVQGTGVDSKQTRISSTGERRHYLGDQVGTVSVTLSDSATVSESSLKDVWGNAIFGATSSERYGFAQREHDGESGLVHMRARQYDPRLGRFTQTDPLLASRASEHYVYGFNNPVTMVDPMGLQASPTGLPPLWPRPPLRESRPLHCSSERRIAGIRQREPRRSPFRTSGRPNSFLMRPRSRYATRSGFRWKRMHLSRWPQGL
jgi:RHS repeat-associated protein